MAARRGVAASRGHARLYGRKPRAERPAAGRRANTGPAPRRRVAERCGALAKLALLLERGVRLRGCDSLRQPKLQPGESSVAVAGGEPHLAGTTQSLLCFASDTPTSTSVRYAAELTDGGAEHM